MYPGPVPKDPVTFWCSVGFFSQASTKLHSPSPLSFPRLEVSYSVLADWSWFKMVWVTIGLYPKTLQGFFLLQWFFYQAFIKHCTPAPFFGDHRIEVSCAAMIAHTRMYTVHIMHNLEHGWAKSLQEKKNIYPGPVPKDPVTFWCSVGFFSQASTKLHSPSPLSFPRLEVSYSVLADWSWFKMVWVTIGLYTKTLQGFFLLQWFFYQAFIKHCTPAPFFGDHRIEVSCAAMIAHTRMYTVHIMHNLEHGWAKSLQEKKIYTLGLYPKTPWHSDVALGSFLRPALNCILRHLCPSLDLRFPTACLQTEVGSRWFE